MSSQSFSQLITVNLQYNDIKITKQCSDVNCVKSVCIRGWSGPHYVTFAPEKSSEHRHFSHSGQVLWFISANLRLINPAKNEIRRISKVILENINKELRNKLQLQQWNSTTAVINWFKNIEKKTSINL